MRLAMQKKFINNIVLFLMGILLLSIFFACMEEPFIEPSKVPYSVLRLGNLSANLDEITVLIDGEVVNPGLQNLQKNSFTDYFDVVAGRRDFVIQDPQTGEVLWQKQVDANSFEEQTMFYAGYYHPSIDTTTIAWVSYSDAYTYLSKDPPPDSLYVYFIHAVGDNYKVVNDTVRTDSSRQIYVEATWTEIAGTDTTVETETILEGMIYGDVAATTLAENHYRFVIRRDDATDELLAVVEGDYTAGKWAWHYFAGQTSDATIVVEERDPLPPRAK